MIDVQVIDQYAEWEKVGQEWSRLVDACADATPFQRPEWLLPWWRNWGSGELFVLTFRYRKRLVGTIPLFIHEWEGRRQVTFAGNGVTDYLGLIVEPEFAMQCANLTFERVAAERDRWDLCDWQDLRADSPLLTASPFGLDVWPVAHEFCTWAALPDHAEAAYDALPHGLRRSIRVSCRRLERLGELQFETITADDGAERVRELIRLHEERWAVHGGPGSLLDSRQAKGLLVDASAAFGSRGNLRLYTLRLNGELLAAIYGLLDRGKLYGYFTGWDPEYGRFSPGSLILDYARKEAARDGARTWEFLRGREPYKYLWGATDVAKFRLMVWHDPKFAPTNAPARAEDYEPVNA